MYSMKIKTYCNGEEWTVTGMYIGHPDGPITIMKDAVVYDTEKFIMLCKQHGVPEDQYLKYINENLNKKEGNEKG